MPRRASAWQRPMDTAAIRGACRCNRETKVYVCNRDKAVLLAHIGKQSLAEGAQIAAAHIDSPGWTSSPIPFMKKGRWPISRPTTGGIRKYQWVTLPLELHGVVVLCSGERVTVNIGAAPDDPLAW